MSDDDNKPAGPGEDAKEAPVRRDRRSFNRTRKDRSQKLPRQEIFKGGHEDLYGYVYSYDGYPNASQFRKTTEKIGEWAKRNCTSFPLDIWKSIESLEEPDQDEWKPEAPGDLGDVVEMTIFKEEVQEFGKRKRSYRDNCTKIYTVVYGQCSEATKAKLEARSDWEETNRDHNLVALLKSINSLMHNQLENDRHAGLTAYESLRTLMGIRQQRHEETADYRRRFTSATEVLEHIGISFGAMFQSMADRILISDFNTTREEATEDQATEAEAQAGENVQAIMFLRQACAARYSEINRDLENDFLKDKDNYPSNITGAYNMLINWKQHTKPNNTAAPLDGTAYTMTDTKRHRSGLGIETAMVIDGKKRNSKRDLSNVKCNNCNEKGHLWQNCPKPYGCYRTDETGTASIMVGNDNNDPLWNNEPHEDELHNDGAVFCQTTRTDEYRSEEEKTKWVFTQNGTISKRTTSPYDTKTMKVIPKGSIGLDSMSTVDLFSDARMLTNIRKAPHIMKVHCNAGFKEVDQIGHLPGYGEVWFDPSAVANILSLHKVTERFTVTFDSKKSDGFVVQLPNGRTRSFTKTDRGLYVSEFLSQNTSRPECVLTIATVNGNKAHFTKREVK